MKYPRNKVVYHNFLKKSLAHKLIVKSALSTRTLVMGTDWKIAFRVWFVSQVTPELNCQKMSVPKQNRFG